MCSIWLFYDVPSQSTPVKLAFLQGVADSLLCASTLFIKANVVNFKNGLKVQVWFWLGRKKGEPRKNVCRVQTTSLLPHIYAISLSIQDLFLFKPQAWVGVWTTGTGWGRDTVVATRHVSPCLRFATFNTMMHTCRAYPANRCQSSLIISQYMANLISFLFFPLYGKTEARAPWLS